MKHGFGVTLLFLFLSGCGGTALGLDYRRFLPDADTEFRSHPLGMVVFNKSGKTFDESEWVRKLETIEAAYRTLKECLALKDEEVDLALRLRSIIILPEDKIYTEDSRELYAFYTLVPRFHFLSVPFRGFYPDVFVRYDQFLQDKLRHEWIHLYLEVTSSDLDADPWHKSPLFQQCQYYYGE